MGRGSPRERCRIHARKNLQVQLTGFRVQGSVKLTSLVADSLGKVIRNSGEIPLLSG